MRKKYLKTNEYSYTVVYEPVKEGGYLITAPLLPGLVTYGRTFEEAQKMARDAIKCYLEALIKDKERIPKETALLEERVTVTLTP